jgi:hypothetical protein
MACLAIDEFIEQTGRSLKSIAEVSLEPDAQVPSPSVVFELLIAGHTWWEMGG